MKDISVFGRLKNKANLKLSSNRMRAFLHITQEIATALRASQ